MSESDRADGDAYDPDADPTEFGEPQYCAYTDYEHGDPVEGFPATGEDATGLERAVWDAVYEVEDPEMPVSVVDLGLIYGIEVVPVTSEEGENRGNGEAGSTETVARVYMTLTYTGCPARDMLQDDVRRAAASPDGVDRAEIELVWSPPWRVEFVTDAGRESLREFGVSL